MFITGGKEIEIDAVATNGTLYCYAITEHVENAGVHSGDATMVFPPQKIYFETVRRIKKIARQLAGALEISGPFNIQFLAKDNDIKVFRAKPSAWPPSDVPDGVLFDKWVPEAWPADVAVVVLNPPKGVVASPSPKQLTDTVPARIEDLKQKIAALEVEIAGIGILENTVAASDPD